MKTYKNKSDQVQVVVGHGVVKPGETIQSLSAIENPNFELVDAQADQSVVGTEAPQPNAIVEATQAPDQPVTEVL